MIKPHGDEAQIFDVPHDTSADHQIRLSHEFYQFIKVFTSEKCLLISTTLQPHLQTEVEMCCWHDINKTKVVETPQLDTGSKLKYAAKHGQNALSSTSEAEIRF